MNRVLNNIQKLNAMLSTKLYIIDVAVLNTSKLLNDVKLNVNRIFYMRYESCFNHIQKFNNILSTKLYIIDLNASKYSKKLVAKHILKKPRFNIVYSTSYPGAPLCPPIFG